MLNKVTKADLGLVYASMGLRVAALVALTAVMVVYGQYAYSGFDTIARKIHTEREGCKRLDEIFCKAPGATDEDRYSDPCIRCQEVDKRNDRSETVVRWMNEHMVNIPVFGLCRLYPSCFHAAADAVSGLLTFWFVLKGLALLMIAYGLVNTFFFAKRNVVPMTKDYMKARFVALPDS